MYNFKDIVLNCVILSTPYKKICIIDSYNTY